MLPDSILSEASSSVPAFGSCNTQSTPRLSVCIPTFNRGPLLEELLASILLAATPATLSRIEVCISDNASTDDTADIVARWRARREYSIVYSRREKNMGADRNYMAAAALAKADFIWFMGSDDTFCPQAIDIMAAVLTDDCVLGICNRIEADFNMRPLFPIHWLARTPENRRFNLSIREERLDYIDRCKSIGGVFSYLSSVVVSRAAWTSIRFDETYLGSAYPHVYNCLKIFFESPSTSGACLTYVHEPLVNNRTGNDHFAADGNVNRVLIDLRAYTRLADDILGADAEARGRLVEILAREWPPVHTTFYMAKNARRDQWNEAVPYLLRLGAPRSLVGLLGIFPSVARALSSPTVRRMAHSVLGRKR